MDSFVGKVLGNRYELIEKIGEGGMALVYRAKCQLLNRFVAVKILKPEFVTDDEFIRKFEKESQAAASLSHQSIVNIYDVGSDGDIKYIVMELVVGETLKSYIKNKKEFISNKEILNITKQIASALDHAHQNQIVHRDIKPHNILINADGMIKVADFGIARAITSATVINTTEILGSVHYASPEQARGGFVDDKSDIYSLGILLFEMATKQVPFEGESPISVALKHLKEPIPSPTAINPNLSRSIEAIIIKATQKEPTDRYQNSREMCRDLNEALLNPNMDINTTNSSEISQTMVMPNLGDIEYTKKVNEDRKILKDKKKPKKKKPKKMNTVKATLTVGLALIAAILVFGGINLYAEFKAENRVVQVPNVTSVNYTEAIALLESSGFKGEVELRINNEDVATDFVISQSESPGKELKVGYTIKLTVSDGPELVKVPELENKSLNEAKTKITSLGLKLGEVEYVFNDAPSGRIISQSPYANTEATRNTTVDLMISKGRSSNAIVMPNLVGMDYNLARKNIESLNLKLGDVTYEFSEEYTENEVISQSVSDGSEIGSGTKVDIVLSNNKSDTEGTEDGEDGTTTEPSDGETPGNEAKMIEKSIYIYTDVFEGDSEFVKFEKVQNGVTEIVHNEEHQKSEVQFTVVVKGEKPFSVNIYFGDTLMKTVEVRE